MPESVLSLLSYSGGEEYTKLNALLSGALYQKLYWEQEQGFTSYLDVSAALSDRIRTDWLTFRILTASLYS